MIYIDSLYRLLDVQSTCTDAELRRAYHHAILKHHPDRNPHQLEAATVKTQELISAYAQLKEYRASESAEPRSVDSEHGTSVTVDGYEVIIQFSFDSGVDIEDIANRKAAFRIEWENFRQNSSDPMVALRLVHAALRAEQSGSLGDLLLNSVLIDSASLLLSLVLEDGACETLIRWSEVLRQSQRVREAVQILEDAIEAGVSVSSVADELRSLHYSWAQYSDPTTGRKATPDVRIEHLRRILELGFEYDYVYKFIAEAYHDLGDDEQARAYLSRAYEINPDLSGAVRISRALGFTGPSAPSSRRVQSRSKYRYSQPGQIPSPVQVREWAQVRNWDAIFEFANPHDYSPRILPQARETLRRIASSLEGCRDPTAVEALIVLLDFAYYWDVSQAAMVSLSKIGDEHTLDLLDTSSATDSRKPANWAACISYLRARISNQDFSMGKAAPQRLLAQAKGAFKRGDYGQARIVLETLLASIDQPDLTFQADKMSTRGDHGQAQILPRGLRENIARSHTTFYDATILLARSCAEMDDVGRSVELVKPLLPNLSANSWRAVSQEVVLWLWSDLAFQQYTPINDDDYRLALELHLELALGAKMPDDLLENLRSLTRWLELLGANDIAQRIRQLIRVEAPGTWYVDKHDREQYVRSVDLSPDMKDFLSSVDERVRMNAAVKLKHMLGGTQALVSDGFLLVQED